jgi:membrane protease YdiL (CAAX protease family)
MRGSGYPLGEFGLGFRHLLGSLVEAAIFTLPVLALVTGMKGAVLLVTGNPQAAPPLEHPDVTARLTDPALLPTLAIYALSCFVQELVVRSAVQASLERFLVGPRHKLYAILVAALLFSMTHLHMSFLFALMAFVPGLFWGWLFARRRNIVGVTLSHIAVGAYVFFVLGVAV